MGMLLKDLRPDHVLRTGSAGQLTAMQGVFHKTLLAWPVDIGLRVFGTNVFQHISEIQAQIPDTQLLMLVGRPMFVCGRELREDQTLTLAGMDFCTNTVAMTPLLKRKDDASSAWTCTRCKDKILPAPVFDSPKRVIRLYPYVAFQNAESIVTLSSVVVLVDEPPLDFDWARVEADLAQDHPLPEPEELPDPWLGAEQVRKGGRRKAAIPAFVFSLEASQHVWLQSQTFLQGKEASRGASH